jgi:predicted RNA-binding Zn-ribbon protein involved in translation (DUF1610 family)
MVLTFGLPSARSGATLRVMSEPVIRRPLRCVQCGYDLEGLSARGACPECGREIVASLASSLDLSTPERDPAPDARRVAWALFLATIGCLAGSARLPEFALHAAAIELSRHEQSAFAPLLLNAAAGLHLVAIFGAALGLLAMALVLPRRHERRVLRIRVLACVGFALWLALSVGPPSAFGLTATALPAGMALLALSPLLRELGPRSRVYRDRESAKQRIDELLLALGIAGIASGCAEFAAQDSTNETMVSLLRLVAAACGGLLLVGLGYLSVNAYWILRSVLRPEPTLSEVLGSDQPGHEPRP